MIIEYLIVALKGYLFSVSANESIPTKIKIDKYIKMLNLHGSKQLSNLNTGNEDSSLGVPFKKTAGRKPKHKQLTAPNELEPKINHPIYEWQIDSHYKIGRDRLQNHYYNYSFDLQAIYLEKDSKIHRITLQNFHKITELSKCESANNGKN